MWYVCVYDEMRRAPHRSTAATGLQASFCTVHYYVICYCVLRVICLNLFFSLVSVLRRKKKKLLALSFTQTASQNAREMSWLRRRKKKQINCGASCVCLGRLTMGNSEAAALHSLRNYNTEFCHCFFFVVAVFVINSLSEEAHKMCAVRYSNEQQQR